LVVKKNEILRKEYEEKLEEVKDRLLRESSTELAHK